MGHPSCDVSLSRIWLKHGMQTEKEKLEPSMGTSQDIDPRGVGVTKSMAAAEPDPGIFGSGLGAAQSSRSHPSAP